jgi:hypothetical protein
MRASCRLRASSGFYVTAHRTSHAPAHTSSALRVRPLSLPSSLSATVLMRWLAADGSVVAAGLSDDMTAPFNTAAVRLVMPSLFGGSLGKRVVRVIAGGSFCVLCTSTRRLAVVHVRSVTRAPRRSGPVLWLGPQRRLCAWGWHAAAGAGADRARTGVTHGARHGAGGGRRNTGGTRNERVR